MGHTSRRLLVVRGRGMSTTDISGELAKIIGVGIGITRYGDEWIISGDRTSLNEAIQALIDRAYQDGYHKRNREIIDEISLGYQKLSNTTGEGK